jgi:protoporphyrin/coproporphyrin ferrochelatase
MAPHWSGMSVETYVERVLQAIDDQGVGIEMSFVRSFHDHPMFVSFLASRLRETLATLDDDARAAVTVLFTAHSLPIRQVDDGSFRCKTCDCDTACRYRDGLQATADLVAVEVGLADHRIAWQSVGRTADPWWGPGIDEMLPALAAEGRSACVVCCAGFAADHLETLYDLDIEAAHEAAAAGIAFARTRMPNDDPVFLDAMAQVLRDHLASR